MALRMIVFALSIINGLWMLLDGFHVLVKGKYIGTGQPGPWSKWVSAMGLEPFAMGAPFVVLGAAWLACTWGLAFGRTWGWIGLFACSILTLWYIPFGTVISVIIIVLLVIYRQR